MACEVLTSGYVSMDHIVKIETPARVGFTSLISNPSCATVFYGGCSVNIACELGRLGVHAAPVLRVGGDWEPNGFRAWLEACATSLEAITVLPDETTSLCYMIEDNEGQHIVLFYPGSMSERYHKPLSEELFEGVRYGVVTVASRPDNEDFFDKCRAHDVPVVFGMKCDGDAFPHEFLGRLLHGSKVIFTNDNERDVICRDFGLSSITELMEKGEATTIVTTYGADGSEYWHLCEDGSIENRHVPACPLSKVVDTAGGGDAYMAGYLFGQLRGHNVWESCLMGATMSSFILEREGCCTAAPDMDAFMERYEGFKATCGESA